MLDVILLGNGRTAGFEDESAQTFFGEFLGGPTAANAGAEAYIDAEDWDAFETAVRSRCFPNAARLLRIDAYKSWLRYEFYI